MKRQPSEWEKIFAKEATEEWISKIYKQLVQLNAKKPNQKMGESEINISLKKTYRQTKSTWKDAPHHSLLVKKLKMNDEWFLWQLYGRLDVQRIPFWPEHFKVNILKEKYMWNIGAYVRKTMEIPERTGKHDFTM